MLTNKIIKQSIYLLLATMIASGFAGTNSVPQAVQDKSTPKVTKIGAIKLISQYYTGDGQYDYFIITADGKKLSTNIPPKAAAGKNAQNKQNSPLIIHMGPPKVIHGQNQTTITFAMQTRSCVACAPISSYNLQYKFNKQGNLNSITQMPSS